MVIIELMYSADRGSVQLYLDTWTT